MRFLATVMMLALPYVASAQTNESFNFRRFSGSEIIRALKYLDRSADVPFSYNPNALRDIQVPAMPDSLLNVDDFLRRSLQGSNLAFEIIASTYVIYNAQDAPETSARPRTNYSITGVVRSATTQEALPYAYMEIIGTDNGTATNSEGLFSLLNMPIDSLRLQVTYLGYRRFVARLDTLQTQPTLTVELRPLSRNLPSVQVTAENADLVRVGPLPSQFTINPVELYKIPSLGETDVFNAIRKLPGVQSGIDSGSGLKIRGGESDQNLVFFDGISVYHVDHFFGFFSAFNSNVVKNIQVRKGGFGARYGGRSSGLVDITGIDGNKINPQITAELTSLSVNVVGELPIIENKASLIVGFRRSFTDILNTQTYQNIFNNIYNTSIPNTSENNTDAFADGNAPDFLYYDFNVKFNFQPTDGDDIALSYYQGQDKLRYQFTGTVDNLTRISEDDTQWGNRGGSIKWAHRWSKRLYSYFIYGQSTYMSELSANESYFFVADSSLASRILYEQNTRVDDQTLRLDQSFEFNNENRLFFGYWYTANEIKLEAQNQINILQDSLQEGQLQAIYSEYEWKRKSLKIKAGLRASYYNTTEKWYPEPRLSATYEGKQGFGYKAAVGRYHQMVRRLNERSLYLSIPETWALANQSGIPVLRSDHFIAGISKRINEWDLDLEGYFKQETGAIEFIFPEFGVPSGDLSQFAVDGDRRIFGADLIAKRKFNMHSLLFNYAYLLAESRFENENQGRYFRSSGFSEHEFNLQYNFEVKRWDFSLGFVLSSGLPYTPILGTFTVVLPNGEVQQFVSLAALNSANLEWYHRMDLSVNYSIKFERGQLQTGFSIYNVYNNRAVRFIDYFEIPQEESAQFDLGQRNVLSLGFTPSLFVKFKF